MAHVDDIGKNQIALSLDDKVKFDEFAKPLRKEIQELREEVERLKKLAYIDLNNLPRWEPHIVIDEDRLIDDD